jgi:hypothetical protein
MITGRIIGRNGNIIVVDFSREPNPPAPGFPGASGLREPSQNEFRISSRLAVRQALAKGQAPPALAGRRNFGDNAVSLPI